MRLHGLYARYDIVVLHRSTVGCQWRLIDGIHTARKSRSGMSSGPGGVLLTAGYYSSAPWCPLRRSGELINRSLVTQKYVPCVEPRRYRERQRGKRTMTNSSFTE